MNKKYFIICIAIIVCMNNISAQYDVNNLKKYWYYRQRLIDYFMVIGDGPGESLVSDKRNPDNPGNGYTINMILFGDQTIYMDWYLGVLATEFKRLFRIIV